MEEEKAINWGGARKGAGRKRKYVKTYFFGATQEVHDILEALECNRAEFINRCILEAVKETSL